MDIRVGDMVFKLNNRRTCVVEKVEHTNNGYDRIWGRWINGDGGMHAGGKLLWSYSTHCEVIHRKAQCPMSQGE